MNDEILDLDALAPKNLSIKFNGETITVPPPSTILVFKMASLGRILSKAESAGDEEVKKMVEEVTQVIYEAVPDLKDKPLTLSQILGLATFLVNAGMPPETKELEKRGITPNQDDDPKKAE